MVLLGHTLVLASGHGTGVPANKQNQTDRVLLLLWLLDETCRSVFLELRRTGQLRGPIC